jgi:hypothetical protein
MESADQAEFTLTLGRASADPGIESRGQALNAAQLLGVQR